MHAIFIGRLDVSKLTHSAHQWNFSESWHINCKSISTCRHMTSYNVQNIYYCIWTTKVQWRYLPRWRPSCPCRRATCHLQAQHSGPSRIGLQPFSLSRSGLASCLGNHDNWSEEESQPWENSFTEFTRYISTSSFYTLHLLPPHSTFSLHTPHLLHLHSTFSLHTPYLLPPCTSAICIILHLLSYSTHYTVLVTNFKNHIPATINYVNVLLFWTVQLSLPSQEWLTLRWTASGP